MTGKELMLYILTHDLENEQIDKDGKIAGFQTIEEVAMSNDVGVETVKVWVERGTLKSITIGGLTLIPEDSSFAVVREKC